MSPETYLVLSSFLLLLACWLNFTNIQQNRKDQEELDRSLEALKRALERNKTGEP